jgi:hypothetical protein
MNIADGGLDSFSGEYLFACFTVLISSASARKRGQQICSLVLRISANILIFNSHCSQESAPLVEAPNLLLEGGGGDSGVVVDK